MKYLYAFPLYRQKHYFKILGANLSRQTLSNWIMGYALEFNNIYSFMKEELLKRSFIQADETTLKVIDARGQDSKSTSYMRLYRSDGTINPIILYKYQKTRLGSCPKNFLRDFSGYLQTDGYARYNKVTTAK